MPKNISLSKKSEIRASSKTRIRKPKRKNQAPEFPVREAAVCNQLGLSAAFVKEYRMNHLIEGVHWTLNKAIYWTNEAVADLGAHLGVIKDRNGVRSPVSATERPDDATHESKGAGGVTASTIPASGYKPYKWDNDQLQMVSEPEIEEFWVQRVGFRNNVIKGERISDGEIFTIFIHKLDKDKYLLYTPRLTPDGKPERMKVYARADQSYGGPIYRAAKRPRRKGYY